MGKIAEAIRGAGRFARQRDVPPPGGATDPYWGFRWGLPRERNYLSEVGDGTASSLVVPAIDFISQGFIEAPVTVDEKRSGEWEAFEDHPMAEIIARPNPYYSGALLWMPTVASYIGDGNGYWIITDWSMGGRPLHMYWTPPWSIEPKGSPDGKVFLTHYRYEPGGGTKGFDLDPSQVVHFRYGLDPSNPRKGMSRLKAVLREIYSDEEAARFVAVLLRNMGVPGLVLSPKGDVTLTQQEGTAVKIDVKQKTTGENRGDPLVMLSETNVSQYGFSPEQLDLSNLRAIPESRVAAALGIPAAVLGFLSGMEQTKVGATMTELRELAYEQGVIPKMRLFTEELHTQLLPHYTDNPERFRIRFDLSEVRVLQEDVNKRSERHLNEVKAGVRTRASYKQSQGENPDPGDDVYLTPNNVTLMGPDAPALETVEFPDELAPRRPIAASRRMKAASKGQLAYLKQVDREGQAEAQRFAALLEDAFLDLGSRAAAAWEQLGVRLVADPQDEPTVDAILVALGLDSWRTRTLLPLWETHYLTVSESTYGAMRLHLALDVGTDLPDPVARRIVALGGRNLGLIDLTAQTRQALFEALARARADGLGPVEAARLIRRFVGAGRFVGMEREKPGSGVRYRAELIARTETLHAQRMSVAEAGREAGFEHFLAFDNRTGYDDPECVARDGQVFTYDEMLRETDEEHPNGTLSWAPQAVA